MPVQPRESRIDMVMRALAALALSPQYTAAAQSYIAGLASGPPTGVFFDIHGQPFNLSASLADTQFGGPAGWMGKLDTNSPAAFAKVYLGDQQQIDALLPALMLIVHEPKSVPMINERDIKTWTFDIEAVMIVDNANSPAAGQRHALALAEAFHDLVYANESLGGLVLKIDAPHPPALGGVHAVAGGMVAAANLVFQVEVFREPRQ